MKKFVYAIAIIALSVSSCQDLTVERSNNGTIKIGKVVISNGNNIVTKASSGTNVTNNGDIIVEESINPSETPLTKASEISTLGDFYLEGYLDSSIMDKVAASDADKRDQHFIKSALVEKGENGWTIAGAPVWRNFVEHYFWAYAGSEIELQPVVENDYTKMSFSYDAQANDGDLIVAYTSQGGEVDHSDHAAEAEDNYIKSLVFNHALAEIVIDPSGLVAKEEGVTIQPDRNLTVKTVLPSVYGKADCEVSADSFNWTVLSESLYSLAPEVKTPYFVIPQDKPSSIELVVTDDLTGVTFPHVAPITPGTWENGMRYRYSLKSEITVPKYIDNEDSDITGFRFDAAGNANTGALVGNLQSKYIKSVDIEWTGVPFASTGSGTYLLLYVAENEIKNINPGNMMNNPKPVDNSYKLVYGCSISNSKGWFSTDSTVPSPTSSESAANTIVSITGFELPDLDSCTLYAYYSGATQGHQGKDNFVALKGLNVSINERRY